MRKTSLTFVVLALLVAGRDRANAAPLTSRLLVDGSVGVEVPMGGATYRDYYEPWPDFGLALGVELWLTRRLALAPELALDGGPYFEQHAAGVTTGAFRIRPGLRILFGFGHGHAFFARFLTGAELLAFGPGGRLGAGTVNAGFSGEPGVGMQFSVARHAVVGFIVATPFSFHKYTATEPSADFALRFFVGRR
jgi:hypothetical protein